MIQNQQKNQQKQVKINPNPINSQQYQKQQPQQLNAQIDKQKFQKFYKELQHEFQSEDKNPEIEKQWKKELDLIKSSNLSKEKILEKNKHSLISLQDKIEIDFKSKTVLNQNYTIQNYFYNQNSTRNTQYSHLSQEELAKEANKIKNDYKSFMEKLKNKQYYTQTLQLMKIRLNDEIGQINSLTISLQQLKNLAYKKEGGIDQELQQMLREQKHINFQQNQELGKQLKTQEKFNEILEKKRNIGQKENNGLLNTITDFQQTENSILQYNQVIKEQEKEIQKLDQQLEQKYQEKAQSQELINLLDDMEYLQKFFKSDKPNLLLEELKEFKLLQNKNYQELNRIWHENESVSEIQETSFSHDQSRSQSITQQLKFQQELLQIQQKKFLTDKKKISINQQIKNKKSYLRPFSKKNIGSQQNEISNQNLNMTSQYENHTDLSKRYSKVQIANRLTVFYVQHDNKIEPFFDNLIDIYKSLFQEGESLKERLIDLEEQKRIQIKEYQTLKKQMEVQSIKILENDENIKLNKEINDLDPQNQILTINTMQFEDHQQGQQQNLLSNIYLHSYIVISTIQNIILQFSKGINLVQDSLQGYQKSLKLEIGTDFVQQIDKIQQEFEIFKQKFYQNPDNNTQYIMQIQRRLLQQLKENQNIQHKQLIEENIKFYLNWIQTDMILKFYIDNKLLDEKFNDLKLNDINQIQNNLIQIIDDLKEYGRQQYQQNIENIQQIYSLFLKLLKEQTIKQKDHLEQKQSLIKNQIAIQKQEKFKQSNYQTKQENSYNFSEKEIPENEQKNILLNQKYINQNYDYIQRNGMSKQQQHILKLKEQEQQNFRADRFASNQTIQQNTIIKKQIGLKEYQKNVQQNNIDPEKDPILKIIKENQDITTKNDENIKKYTVNKKYFRESPINQSIDQDYNNYANDSVNEGFQGNKGNYDQMNFMSQNSMPQPIKREMLKVGQKMNQKNIDQLQKFYKNQIIQPNNYFADLIEEVEYVEKMRKQFDKRVRSAEPPQNMLTKQINTVNYNQKKQISDHIQSPKNQSLQNNNNKTYDEDLKIRKISQNKGSQYISSNNTLEPFVNQNQLSFQSPKKSQILSTNQNQNLVNSLKNLSSQQQLQNQQPQQLGISSKNIYNNKLNINSKSKSSQKFQQKNSKAQTQQNFNRLKIVKTFKKQQDQNQNEIMKKENLNFLIHQDQKLQKLKKIHKEQLQKEIKEENQQQEFMEHAQQLLQYNQQNYNQNSISNPNSNPNNFNIKQQNNQYYNLPYSKTFKSVSPNNKKKNYNNYTQNQQEQINNYNQKNNFNKNSYFPYIPPTNLRSKSP